MSFELPNLLQGQIHVWRVPLDTAPTHSEILSPEERDRAARFYTERDRTRYHSAHTALRQILARYANLEPQALEFRVNAYGKPSLVHTPTIEFNLSHSHSNALVAIASSPIGVDIEQIRTVTDVVPLAQRFFAPAESRLVEASPDRFFEFWTRKEAFIKAIGMGVSFPLESFDTCSERVNIYAPIDSLTWYAQTFHPTPNYIAALVTSHPNMTLKQFEWGEDS